MGSVWNGQKLKLSLFGESHGDKIGIVIDNFPAGFKINLEYINFQMERRKPKKDKYSTSRNESDEVEIICGIFNGYTSGAPICATIKNKDYNSKDYSKIKNLLRPGHADYSAYKKYNGYNDYRGGGHFSGRMTAPLVFAGALCASYIKEKYDIEIYSKICSIAGIMDQGHIENIFELKNMLKDIGNEAFPLHSKESKELIEKLIERTAERGNSVGGMIETYVFGLSAGFGNPFFNSLESEISRMIFSIPAIKGILFGAGEKFTHITGKESNDEYYMDNKEIKTSSNNNGGIIGGISNGMPIYYQTVVKPTSSISIEQNTVNINTNREEKISIEGRHDACIVPRVIPVIDNATAIVIMDTILSEVNA